jgi:Protein of unknown function (DUF3106)
MRHRSLHLLLVCLAGFTAVSASLAQTLGAPLTPKSAPAAIAQSATQPSSLNQPLWKDLSGQQQAALRPLGANWDALALGQKRKWLSVAKDFEKLPAAQQAKMHTRMTDWTALSSQQRADARQNFAQHRELTDGLTAEQRKVQWQAYQELSAEQKRKLAESALKAPSSGAATAIKPQAVLKKEPPPEFGTGKVLAKAKAAPNTPAPGKKITVASHVADQGSILPGNAAQETTAKP